MNSKTKTYSAIKNKTDTDKSHKYNAVLLNSGKTQ